MGRTRSVKRVLARIDLARMRRREAVLADAANVRGLCLHRKVDSCCCLLCGTCRHRHGIPERVGTMRDVNRNVGVQKGTDDIVVTVALQQTQHPRLV